MSKRNHPTWRGSITLEVMRYIKNHPGCRPSEVMAGVTRFKIGWLWMRHLKNQGYVEINHPRGAGTALYTLTKFGLSRLNDFEHLS